jgi:type VI secretion system protein ImpM
MTRGPTASTGGFAAGWYGKVPATGDFIARRVPASFREAWDRWLTSALPGAQQRFGAHWRDAFLSMPVWRFVFSPGFLTSKAWAGLMLPSVDAVGRHYPLAIAAALPSTSLDLVATLYGASAWYQRMEEAALSAIGPRADLGHIDAAIAARPFREEWLRYPEARDDTLPIRGVAPQMLSVTLSSRDEREPRAAAWCACAERLSEPFGAWLAEPSELFGRALLLCEALPPAAQLCAMMDGRWLEHGWTVRDEHPVS